MSGKFTVSQLKEIKNYPFVKEYQDDKQTTMLAVDYSYQNFKYASDRLKNDKEVCLFAAQKSGNTLCYMGNAAKEDKEIVKAAVSDTGSALKYADKKILNDKEIALLAMRTCISVLNLLGENLKDDEEVVLAAINKNPFEVEYASERLRGNVRIMTAAYKKDRRTIVFGADKLFENEELLKSLLNVKNGVVGSGALYNQLPLGVFKQIQAFGFKVSLSLQRVNLLTIERDKLYYLLKASDCIPSKKKELLHCYVEKDDGQIVSLIISKGQIPLSTVEDELKYATLNRKIRTLPILLSRQHSARKNHNKSAHEKSERDKLISSLKRKTASSIVTFTNNACRYLDDRDVVLTASMADGKIIFCITPKYRDDKEIVKNCIDNYTVCLSDPPVLSVISKNLTSDKEIALSACKKDIRNYDYIGENLKDDKDVLCECKKQNYLSEGKIND